MHVIEQQQDKEKCCNLTDNSFKVVLVHQYKDLLLRNNFA